MGKYSHKKKKKSGKGRSSGFSVVLALLLLVAVVAGIWFFLSNPGTTPSLNNVTFGGIQLDGMTQESATEALNALDEKFHTSAMVLSAGNHTVEIAPEESHADLDVEAAIADIFGNSSATGSVNLETYFTLDRESVQSAIEHLADLTQQQLVETSYYVEGDDPAQGQTLYVTMGNPGYILDSDKLLTDAVSAYYNGTFYAEGNLETTEPASIDFAAVFEEYYVPPVDAQLDPNTGAITKEQSGYGFDLEELNTLFSTISYGETVSLSIKSIPAAVTEEDLLGTLFQDVLASFSTPHTSDEDRNTNLRLACEAINGMVLEPGDVFSYNDALGERTPERGYRLGNSYENGETVQTYGGGICQVSSTLYYCALLSDLEIVERYCHMYTPDYIDYGMDATVSWGGLDFRFQNNTDYPIRISADVSDGYVNITLRGTDTKDYYVDMDYYIVAVYNYDTIYKDLPVDNEKGYYDGQTITSPIIGYGVDTYRCKYSKATDELISEEYEDYSDYDHRDAVICRIVQEDSDDTYYGDDDYFIGSGGGISPDGG